MIQNPINPIKLLIFSFFLLFSFQLNAQPHFTQDISKKEVEISHSHYGVFFEDINRPADGGIYVELIRSQSFEEAATPEFRCLLNLQVAVASTSIESQNLLNNVQTKNFKNKRKTN